MSLDGILPFTATLGRAQAADAPGERAGGPAQPKMQGLGQDAFLKLLLAELKNQDPLKPMEDKDFIAQVAQFNSLSQLIALNTSMQTFMRGQTLAQGSALIGKTVRGLASTGEQVSGVVSGLRLNHDDQVLLDVEGQTLPLEAVDTVEGEV